MTKSTQELLEKQEQLRSYVRDVILELASDTISISSEALVSLLSENKDELDRLMDAFGVGWPAEKRPDMSKLDEVEIVLAQAIEQHIFGKIGWTFRKESLNYLPEGYEMIGGYRPRILQMLHLADTHIIPDSHLTLKTDKEIENESSD